MTREVKFRIRDIRTNKILGYEWVSPEGWWVHREFANGRGNTKLVEKGRREQFTGLKDRNDIEIYEDDIISMFGDSQRSTVRWGGDDWGAWIASMQVSGRSPVDEELLANHLRITEVVGNIHENPDLLEGLK